MTTLSNFTTEQKAEIIKRHKNGETRAEIADHFGVKKGTISNYLYDKNIRLTIRLTPELVSFIMHLDNQRYNSKEISMKIKEKFSLDMRTTRICAIIKKVKEGHMPIDLIAITNAIINLWEQEPDLSIKDMNAKINTELGLDLCSQTYYNYRKRLGLLRKIGRPRLDSTKGD